MLRIMIIATAALSLGGCLTMGGVREIRSNPTGAYLSIEGFGSCETPCTVKLDGPRQARLARIGYVTQDIIIEPGIRPLTVTMVLAAASEDVDALALPDLE